MSKQHTVGTTMIAPTERRLTYSQRQIMTEIACDDGYADRCQLPEMAQRDRTLDSLEDRGLIIAGWNRDLRADCYRLTDAGRAMMHLPPAADCEIVRIDRTDGTETRVAHDLTRELAERARESMDGVRVHLLSDGSPRYRYRVREQGGGR